MNLKSIRVHYFVFSINIWHINDTVKRFIVYVSSKDADTPLIGGFISEGWIKFLIVACKCFMTFLLRKPVKKYSKNRICNIKMKQREFERIIGAKS